MKIKGLCALVVAVMLSCLCPVISYAEYDVITPGKSSASYDYTYNGVLYEKFIPYESISIKVGKTVTIKIDKDEYANAIYAGDVIVDSQYFNVLESSGTEITFTALKTGNTKLGFIQRREVDTGYRQYTEKILCLMDIKITDDLKISLTSSQKTMSINKTKVLEASISPYELYINNISTYGLLKWTSSNSDCVSISCNGKEVLQTGNTETLYTYLSDGAITLTSKEAGTAIITCELSLDSSVTATCVVTVSDPTKVVTGVSLNTASISLPIDGTQTLVATIEPSDATNKNVTWNSSNTDVVIVSDGILYPKGVGTSVVTVTTDEGGYTASCDVTVHENEIHVKSISLPDTCQMYIGYVYDITANINPSNATNQNVIWESSNTDVIFIVNRYENSKNVQVKAEAIGNAVLTATTEDGNYSASCLVSVEQKVSGVSLNESSVNLNVGDKKSLIVTVLPEDATNQNVIWTSSDTSVATVSNGVVEAVGAGNATITVKTEDGNYTDTCSVSVTAPVLQKVSTPTASALSGEISQGTKVTLSTQTDGATIYYTTDGSEPTTSSSKYTEELTIDANTTIKAIAVKEGMETSSVATFTYTIIAENMPIISISNGKGKAGKTVDVTLDIKENTGIAGMILKLSYDEELTLTNIAPGTALSSLTFTPPAIVSKNPCTLLWDGIEADTTNGTILTLTFAISDTAADGEYDVNVSYTKGDIYDGDTEDINVQIDNGVVTVYSYKTGDLNEDDVINAKDITLLRKRISGDYGVTVNEDAADVNKDGALNAKDITMLRKFVSGDYGIVLD